jgi:hypothetical protein
LPLAVGWLDDCVIAVITLLVELAILPVLLVRVAPALLEAV